MEFDKELSEGDQCLKRVKDIGSRRWQYSSVVREGFNATADSHSDTEEYGLSLHLTNLVKGIMNAIGACPVQLNGNMWEVITMCDHLNKKWEKEGKVRRITPEDVLQFYGVKNYKASGRSYFCASATQRRFFNLNSTGQTCNDNVIWVMGNCLQRDDEELLDHRFRTVKKSVKSQVERKELLLDEVVEEVAELEFVLDDSASVERRGLIVGRRRFKTQSTRSMAGANEGKKLTTRGEGQTNLAKTPRIDSLGQLEPLKLSKIAQKYPKKWMLKALSASGTTGSGEVTKEKRRRVKPSGESGEKVAKGRPAMVDDLKEVEERARLAALLGEENTRKMVVRSVKGICLSIEEGKSELKKGRLSWRKN
ncbi:hypothetical protein GIB67_005348 [Kingdonia uniflora]|uniref:Uncharacterized protein n=1 Tax=Kingdonia uniflora TaxID=39325 RepID=A0A7J7NCJ7_9MAGN|nr:hypothetical protein GIB67_005348 [Kingdonia uniflora]